jgi:hypothetical protein
MSLYQVVKISTDYYCVYTVEKPHRKLHTKQKCFKTEKLADEWGQNWEKSLQRPANYKDMQLGYKIEVDRQLGIERWAG